MAQRQLMYELVQTTFGIVGDFQLSAQPGNFLESGFGKNRHQFRLLWWQVHVGSIKIDDELVTK